MNKGASGKDSLIVFGLYVREDQIHVGLYLFLWVATALGGGKRKVRFGAPRHVFCRSFD